MVDLGVGKNMVRAIRFWEQAAGVIEPAPERGGYRVTQFGKAVFDAKNGADAYLEDIRTLWLLHWKLSTNLDSPLLAWDYLLNRWQEPTLTRTAAVAALKKEADQHEQKLSSVTIEQHFETFLHTYVPTRGRKGEVQEDNLDSPLVELEMLTQAGEQEVGTSGRHETVYAFRRDEKPDIAPELFLYCLVDFFEQQHRNEETLPFNAVVNGHGSPGQIFKLPEEEIRMRFASLDADTSAVLTFSEAAQQQQLRWRKSNGSLTFSIFSRGFFDRRTSNAISVIQRRSAAMS